MSETARRFRPVRVDAKHDLQEQAGRHLRKVLGLRADRLTVVAADETFYVAGRVRSFHEKQAAQEVLRELCGGRTLVSDLMVA